MRIAVIGDGGWGTALALTLHRNGHSVCVWGPDEAYLADIRATGINSKFLAGVELPAALEWSAAPQTVLAGAEAVVMVVPSHYIRGTLERFREAYLAGGSVPVVSATKGFDETSHKRISEMITECWDVKAPAVLSGPSIAPETARGVPTAVTVASADEGTARFFQDIFMGERFRVYTSTDVTGVEIGGALKNVIALAGGVCDGLGYGDNAKAALITRGLAEMRRLGIALGAESETFYGLSGIGDLMVTCMSPKSRNRSVGERIGRGEAVQDILAGMVQVAEGVWACGVALVLAKEHGIPVPIMEQVNAIIHENKPAAQAVQDLMMRAARPEQDGAEYGSD